MTFSIVAYCPRTGQVGVSAATAMPAVGKLLSHARAKVGAVATQASVNPYLGYDGLRLLERLGDAEQVVAKLIGADPEPQVRQLGVIDCRGRTAVWTGEQCLDWAGHLEGPHFSTQGNRLAGPHVLEAAARVMNETQDLELAERLLMAIEAGDAEGGDTEGERSATIFVFDTEEYPLWDVRVDEHKDPMKELRRLFNIFRKEFLPQMKGMPSRKEYPGFG
jgi:uncharacterized Ntn-hydrolase superfamily protein